MANDSRYGLGASVWTKDKARGERVARQILSGSVCINDSSITYGALEVPFGGLKESGVGSVNGGNHGLRAYSHALPIITDRFGQKEEAVWYPFTDDKVQMLRKAVNTIWGTPLKWLV
jgi:acyl-CoA reductase-like NAD-dependent aldehyde dehydrogenase